jgi:hypothetical protein
MQMGLDLRVEVARVSTSPEHPFGCPRLGQTLHPSMKRDSRDINLKKELPERFDGGIAGIGTEAIGCVAAKGIPL